MYLIKNDIDYVKKHGYQKLHSIYETYGYGYALSFKNGELYPNIIIDIYQQP